MVLFSFILTHHLPGDFFAETNACGLNTTLVKNMLKAKAKNEYNDDEYIIMNLAWILLSFLSTRS